MFTALPAETVLEARARTRRATALLLFLLILVYIASANLVGLAALSWLRLELRLRPSPGSLSLIHLSLALSAAALLAALAHFLYARSLSLEELLRRFGARPLDLSDERHARLGRLVQEAEAASGIRPILPVVLPDPGRNAFSLMDGKGRCAIGATEGALSSLEVTELGAVVAHEAAHLIHRDSALVTSTCSLFAVFGYLQDALGQALRQPRRGNRRGNAELLLWMLWLGTGLGRLLTKLVSMAVSRQREYLADAAAVGLCKDPLALARALQKVSRGYRGMAPSTYAAVFITNPSPTALDEGEGLFSALFSDHPPLKSRLERLLGWARKSLKDLGQAQAPQAASAAKDAAAAGPRFLARQGEAWVGPYDARQWQALGTLTPSTWISLEGSQRVEQASDLPELLPLFKAMLQAPPSPRACPRCKVPLAGGRYEGAELEECAFCHGHFLKGGVLERLLSREEQAFDPDKVKGARAWRDGQQGPLKDRKGAGEGALCPACSKPMGKVVHSSLTQVVLDRCPDCRGVWCDTGELEVMQMLVESARRGEG